MGLIQGKWDYSWPGRWAKVDSVPYTSEGSVSKNKKYLVNWQGCSGCHIDVMAGCIDQNMPSSTSGSCKVAPTLDSLDCQQSLDPALPKAYINQ